MPSLKDFKTRIKSLNYTSKITKAMYVMASVKFKRSLPSFKRCMEVYLHADRCLSSLLYRENVNFIGKGEDIVIVFTADKGLCGSFNKKILKELDSYLAGIEKYKIICVGSKAISHVNKKYPGCIDEDSSIHLKDFSSDTMAEILLKIVLSRSAKSIKIVYGKFISAAFNLPDKIELLPYRKLEASEAEFILEPYSKVESIEILVNFYIRSLLDFVQQSSINSEFSSRMISMDGATKNAKDLSDKLTIKANKLRQSIITSELIDIVSSSRVSE